MKPCQLALREKPVFLTTFPEKRRRFSDANKASMKRGGIWRETPFLMLCQAFPVLGGSHVLQPFEYIIKGNVIAVPHSMSNLLHTNPRICQQRMSDVHLGPQHMVVKGSSR